MGMTETKFNDTAEGAIRFVTAETIFDILPTTVAVPDPAVEGVWKVAPLREVTCDRINDNLGVVIYMAGYRDPFGRVRETNDFEAFEIDQSHLS